MDDENVKAWIELLDSLTPNEAKTFLSKLKHVNVKARQKIFRQGECDDRLIFIDSGQLKLSYWNQLKKKSDIFTHLEKGDVCGTENFFSHSPHTSSLTATEDSVIRCLYKKDYINLLASNPTLENKLRAYCEKYQKKIVFEDPEEPGRRIYKRHPTSLKGRLRKIDSKGNVLEPALPVKVTDISAGGVGCSVDKIGVKEAENLFKSQVQITVTNKKDNQPCNIDEIAKVVSVHFVPYGASKIHLQFQIPLLEKNIFDMVQFDSIY